MKKMVKAWKTIAALAVVGVLSASEPAHSNQPSYQDVVDPFLWNYCIDCHDDAEREGGLSFEELTSVTPENASVWKRIWEQVALKDMPPRDEKDQPGLMERYRVSQWITANLELSLADHSGFDVHLHPAKGNHLDHDLLFHAQLTNLQPPSTPSRIWRIDPIEHLTRINDLIFREDFDPAGPAGQRARGDILMPDGSGRVKVYPVVNAHRQPEKFGKQGQGVVLSTRKKHGLKSFAHLYTVNGSEADRVSRLADRVLRVMLHGPREVVIAKPAQPTEKKADPTKKEEVIDLTDPSLAYQPETPLSNLMKDGVVNESLLAPAVNYLFEALTLRPPTKEETKHYVAAAKNAMALRDGEDGLVLGLTPIFLDRDALFRPELASAGAPDEHGRVALRGQELLLAVNAALSYLGPDQALKDALAQGQLETRADVEREVRRLLAEPSVRKPRMLQFFREYFDYHLAGTISKDGNSLVEAMAFINRPNELSHYNGTSNRMVYDTDRLVELIVSEDKDVLRELLTTDRAVYDPKHKDSLYFMSEAQRAKFWPNLTGFQAWAEKVEQKKMTWDARREYFLAGIKPYAETAYADLGEPIAVRTPIGSRERSKQRMLGRLHPGQRMGILTHPSWLISHSDAMDNHAIHRGIWIRERLLGDAVGDVPITVNAMLPNEPHATLRHRMRVTEEPECWRCHQKMDPLGFPFEMYSHVGFLRTEEKGQPVDASGEIFFSGDPSLDGPVAGALDMIEKLASSERVEQVFVRHVFRFWMGRNETLNDAPVLRAAHRAYRESGGSFKELLVSLLTSDAFLYRTVER